MADSIPSEGHTTYLADRRRTDRNYLRALSIFHYLLAAIFAVSCEESVRGLLAMHRIEEKMPFHSAAREQWDWFWPSFTALLGLAAVLNAVSGWSMTQRRAWRLSVVVAGLDLLYVPIGTLLGVFTLIMLLRGSVCEWYRENAR